MRIDKIHVFIGSSSEMRVICELLSAKLSKYQNIKVNPWYDSEVIPLSMSIPSSIENAIKKNDFFVFLFSPDFQVTNYLNSGGDDSLQHVTRRNVILEVGAAWGRYGPDRLIMFSDERSPPPTSLSGMNIPHFNAGATGALAEREVEMMAGKIFSHIDSFVNRLSLLTSEGKTAASDGRLHWLTFFKCAPNSEEAVLKYVFETHDGSVSDLSINIEDAGLIYGDPDGYILFSAPSLDDSTVFLKKIRAELNKNLRGLDTRLIYNNAYWSLRSDFGIDKKFTHISLYCCKPDRIENVFLYLSNNALDLSKSNGEKNNGTTTQHVGILLGKEDVFCITSADSWDDLRKFAATNLMYFAEKDWLRDNSTSLPFDRTSDLKQRTQLRTRN